MTALALLLAVTKVGIIGCDTSHTIAFTKTLNVDRPDYAEGFRVTAAHKWGSKDIVSSTNRYTKYIAQLKDMGVEMCETVDDLLAKVDVVCLETNDGREHLWQAEKCFKAKKRVFIDKPIAEDYPHAKAIYDLGRKYGAEYFSSSTLRYASANAAAHASGTNFASCVFYAPCPLETQGTHSRYVWYGIHAFETAMTVMGRGAVSVRAYAAGPCDFATISWADGRVANLKLDRTPWGYGGWAFPGDAPPAPLCGPEGYEPMLKGAILPFFRTGDVPVPHEETLELFAIMEAAAKSQAEDGREVSLAEITGSQGLRTEVADFRGPIDMNSGWQVVSGEAGKVVYIPFEGYYESKGGRLESPKFALDKGPNENAWYLLSFDAKIETNGYWWVDFYDKDGNPLPDVNSRLYATSDWQSYEVVVPTRPEAVTAQIAFVAKKAASARDVRMRRISAEDAAQWCEKFYATLPQLEQVVPKEAWANLPKSKSALNSTNEFRIVFLGDSIMNDTWCGNFGALLKRDFPRANLKLYLSVRGSTGCWYYHEKDHFEEYVSAFCPDLVVLGGISNWRGPEKFTVKHAEDWMVETIERCQAIGAEVVVCTPPPSYEFRKVEAAEPFDFLLCENGGLQHLRWDFHKNAAMRTGAQLWDLTTAPCEAIARSGKPLNWFKRDSAHNDERGKQLIAQALAAYFRMAACEKVMAK